MRLIFCDRCDGLPLATRLQSGEVEGRLSWAGGCTCGGVKTIMVLCPSDNSMDATCAFCKVNEALLLWQGKPICKDCWHGHVKGEGLEPA